MPLTTTQDTGSTERRSMPSIHLLGQIQEGIITDDGASVFRRAQCRSGTYMLNHSIAMSPGDVS
jgi:hypothetical protein